MLQSTLLRQLTKLKHRLGKNTGTMLNLLKMITMMWTLTRKYTVFRSKGLMIHRYIHKLTLKYSAQMKKQILR